MAALTAILGALALLIKPIAEALLPLLLERAHEPKVIVTDATENQARRDEFADVITAHELRVLASAGHDSA